MAPSPAVNCVWGWNKINVYVIVKNLVDWKGLSKPRLRDELARRGVKEQNPFGSNVIELDLWGKSLVVLCQVNSVELTDRARFLPGVSKIFSPLDRLTPRMS